VIIVLGVVLSVVLSVIFQIAVMEVVQFVLFGDSALVAEALATGATWS